MALHSGPYLSHQQAFIGSYLTRLVGNTSGMDKSGRSALSANVKALQLQAKQSRRAWASANGINVKTVERAETGEGEKGVTMQGVDDIAKAAGLAAWQLLVPGLDPKSPPALSTEPRPEPQQPMTLGQIALQIASAVQHLEKRKRDGVAGAIAEMVKQGPDETEVPVIDAWTPGITLMGLHQNRETAQMEALSSVDTLLNLYLKLGTDDQARFRDGISTGKGAGSWVEEHSNERRFGLRDETGDASQAYRSPKGGKPAAKGAKK